MNLLCSIFINIYYSLIKKISEFFVPLPSTDDIKAWTIRNSFLRFIGMNIGTNVALHSGLLTINGLEKNIFIDDYTTIGYNLKIYAFNVVSIGKYCMIAGEVNLSNGGHDTSTFEPYSSKIEIGNGVWIGHGATIIAKQSGLMIGNNAIIGACSLVLNDIPENAIVAGVPAKIIGYRKLPKKVWHLGNKYFCPRTFQIVKEEIC